MRIIPSRCEQPRSPILGHATTLLGASRIPALITYEEVPESTSGKKTSSTISLMALSDRGSNVIRISWRARSVGSSTIRGVRRAATISPRLIARPRRTDPIFR